MKILRRRPARTEWLQVQVRGMSKSDKHKTNRNGERQLLPNKLMTYKIQQTKDPHVKYRCERREHQASPPPPPHHAKRETTLATALQKQAGKRRQDAVQPRNASGRRNRSPLPHPSHRPSSTSSSPALFSPSMHQILSLADHSPPRLIRAGPPSLLLSHPETQGPPTRDTPHTEACVT
jgi:hypothetical protein